ncbi:MAG: sulfite reductase subunit A [Nitrospirae bacterium]|nr:MAG: sulfite reductase subunit A [Nitrospirota bacterium]
MTNAIPQILPKSGFPRLIEALRAHHYRIVGPVVRDGALHWDEIAGVEDLPIGWQDTQQPGQYRLERTETTTWFGIVHGPDSIKRLTFVPREPLLTIERKAKKVTVTPQMPEPTPTALLGVRACDVAGLLVHDRIFLQGRYADPYYQVRRDALLVIAVNCTRAHKTCFCASMGTGPRAQSGYDLALTEFEDEFLVSVGSEKGREIIELLELPSASPAYQRQEQERIDACAASQVRGLQEQHRLPQGLYEVHEHPRWETVAHRCLACANCTMVCPTCFCHTVEDHPDLSHTRNERVRLWDSCFTPQHGMIHGKNFRPTIADRYRMWLTHKLASWIDQFGVSGCVGCGRCLTWCPVGIDLTEELHALMRENVDQATP